MAAPVTPEDVCSLRVSVNSSPCAKATSAAKTTDALCALLNWMLNADGTISDAFREEAGVAGGGGTGGTSGLAAPSGVTASSTRTTDVTVNWTPVSAATSYSLFRGPTANSAEMTLIASSISGTTYADTTAVLGTHYFYAVKAVNVTLISGFSAVAEGVKKATPETFTPTIYSNTVTPLTLPVPTGANRMKVELWGGGGRGGGNNTEGGAGGWFPSEYVNQFGGGGSSGSMLVVDDVVVADTEVYILVPGGSGLASAIYKTTAGNSVKAFATAGATGGYWSGHDYPGTGGIHPASAGTNALGSGTATPGYGNDGADGTLTVGGDGGAAVNDVAGAGGKGSNNKNPGAGAGGQIIVTFSTV